MYVQTRTSISCRSRGESQPSQRSQPQGANAKKGNSPMRPLSVVSAAFLLSSPAGGLVAVPRGRHHGARHGGIGGSASLLHAGPARPHSPLVAANKGTAGGASALPMAAASLDGDDVGGGGRTGFRSRVRSAASSASRRVSSLRNRRSKLTGACLAFSALFFAVAGRNGDRASLDRPPSAEAARTASAGSAGRVVRGGSSSAPSMLSSMVSRLRPTPDGGAAVPARPTLQTSWRTDVRGGAFKSKTAAVEEFGEQTTRTFMGALRDLNKYMKGPKSDTLCLLLATALITPLCKSAGLSPILGFLASGMLLGPNGLGVISGIHNTEHLGELGIVFFLFEMGIELSVERLKSMKKDVFGLGLSQYLSTAAVIGLAAKVLGGLSGPASVVVGGALSLSSSAFVLQLLKDKKELATRFGKASFGVLLLQDLAVVPLLVATPILAGSGSLASALGNACVKAGMALSGIALAGRFALNPLFKTVAAANSQEAFLGLILMTALGMSFLTEGLGLSNTLGAFLAGVLLSETKYRYQVEADIAPFRGILLGLFFVTVGFEIDVGLIASNLPRVSAIVAGILGLKAGILALLSKAFGLSTSNALRTGLILSQGGEFAFVTFGLARSLGILDPATTRMLLTSVSLTMALTPFLDQVGEKFAKKLEEGADFTHYTGQDEEAIEITDDVDSGFVAVVGYGVVGKVVTDLLDKKFIPYVGMEKDPKKAIEARNKGLPVFFGDVGRSEVCEAFNIGKAKAVIVCIADKAEATRAVIALRRQYPDKPIFARASDADHAKRLQTTLDVAAMVPILPEDNLLLTLPFGGAVLRSLGAPAEEVNYILAEKRTELLSGKELKKFEEETVLAQLGVERKKDADEVDEDKDEEDCDVTMVESSETAEPALAECEPEKKLEEPEMTPLLKQVVDAVCEDEPKAKKDVQIEAEIEVIEDPGELEDTEMSKDEKLEEDLILRLEEEATAAAAAADAVAKPEGPFGDMKETEEGKIDMAPALEE